MIEVIIPHPTIQQETICWDGWGTSLAWWANAVGACAAVRQELCTLLFSPDPTKGLGMNIVRYNIGGACQDHAAEYRTGGAVPCVRRPDGSYNWSADAAQTAVLLEAAKLGADVFEAFVNSPPWFWTVSGSSRGHQRPYCDNLHKKHVGDFADFCADVLEYFSKVYGIKMQSLSPFNEPASPAWCLKFNNRQEGCYFSKGRAHKVLRALSQHSRLQGTQLVAFEHFCVHDTWSDLKGLSEKQWSDVRRVNTHTYTSKHFFKRPLKALLLWQDNTVLWRKLLKQQLQHHGNKPLWVSEFATGQGALALAKQVLKDLATLQPSAWVYWQAVEGAGSNWGLLEVPLDTCTDAGSAPAAASTYSTTAAANTAAGVAALTNAADIDGPHTRSTPCAAGVGHCNAVSKQRVGCDVPAQPGLSMLQQGFTCSCSSSSNDPVPQITVHANYFVLQFLMQCIPRGCCYRPLKAFGKYGVLAYHSSSHVVLVFVNASSHKTKKLSIDAQQWVDAVAAAGSTTASTAKAAAPNPGLAGMQQEPQYHNAAVQICCMDVAALQPVNYTAAVRTDINRAANTTRRDSRRCREHWPLVIDVPGGHLCRIDVVL